MKRQKIIILAIVGVVAIGIISGGLFLSSKKDGQAKENPKPISTQITGSMYTVKQEIKEDTLKINEVKSDKSFEVGDILVKSDKLTVTVNTDIEDSSEAYRMAVSIDNITRDLNKEKIKTDGINIVEVILKGKDKSWMYNGSNSINEIILN